MCGLSIVVWPDDLLLRAVRIARKRAPFPSNHWPPTDREIINVIRHCLVNRRADTWSRNADYLNSYDSIATRIKLKGGDPMPLKIAVLRLIAEHYPRLAQEANRQIDLINT